MCLHRATGSEFTAQASGWRKAPKPLAEQAWPQKQVSFTQLRAPALQLLSMGRHKMSFLTSNSNIMSAAQLIHNPAKLLNNTADC